MYSKAIAALITPIVVSLLMPLGITAETPIAQVIEVLVIAATTAAMVFFVPNRP